MLGDRGMLLTNGDIDAIELLAFVSCSAIVPVPLVGDGVNGNGGLATTARLRRPTLLRFMVLRSAYILPMD
jgi:hypothetical protein